MYWERSGETNLILESNDENMQNNITYRPHKYFQLLQWKGCPLPWSSRVSDSQDIGQHATWYVQIVDDILQLSK